MPVNVSDFIWDFILKSKVLHILINLSGIIRTCGLI